jgi:hypothetical protein
MQPRPSIHAAVFVERLTAPTRWEDWRFRIADVVVDVGQFGAEPRALRDDGAARLTVFPGFPVTLYPDEGEGYYLNLTSGAPVWFVMWRIDDRDPSNAWPELVTLSYNEAGRRLDAQERVDNVPLPQPVCEWLHAFTTVHYKPEPRKRRRPASFVAPEER